MATANATARALGSLIHDLRDRELQELLDSKNRPKLKKFLQQQSELPYRRIEYNQSFGLVRLILRALTEGSVLNLSRMDERITQDRFPPQGMRSKRTARCKVVAIGNGRPIEQELQHLTTEQSFANAGDLAIFMHNHPEEMGKWDFVLTAHTLWTDESGVTWIPGGFVEEENRGFMLFKTSQSIQNGRNGLLVLG
jgi:hypothetical protein